MPRYFSAPKSMVNRSLHVLVDFLAGIAIGTVAIVAWWLGLAIALVVVVRLSVWVGLGAAAEAPRGPIVVAVIIAYCVLSLPACRWLERKVF